MTIKKIKTDDGVEHSIDYEALENKPVAALNVKLLLNMGILEAAQRIEFDVSDYLPNDGCNYLVSVQCTGALYASGYAALYGTTDLAPNDRPYCFYRLNCKDFTLSAGGTCQMLVGSGRKIYIRSSGTQQLKDVDIVLAHYIKAS